MPADRLISQAQNKDRNFTYYVHWPKLRKTILPRKWSKKREYFINFNIEKDATNEQIIKAYFFGLKLDEILNQKLDERLTPASRKCYHHLTKKEKQIGRDCLRDSIFEAEEYFELFDFDTFFKELEEKGWKLDTLYIDKGTNRYKIE